MADEEILRGGVANAGAVRRIGDVVLRPSNENSATIHALLRHVRRTGFDGVPQPLSFVPDGEERLVFIPGDVPFPPFPRWSQTDDVLASTVKLLRRFHDATVGFVAPEGATWSKEMADPGGGEVICHNDVCPENVVFRDGEAVALLDFDFAAPGDRLFDLARLVLMTVPIDAPEDSGPPRAGSGSIPLCGCGWRRMRTGWHRTGPHSSTPSGATSPMAAPSCSDGSTEARRRFSPCSTRWGAWSATTVDGRGSRPIAAGSSIPSADRTSR